jgi:hypothetical protein
LLTVGLVTSLEYLLTLLMKGGGEAVLAPNF